MKTRTFPGNSYAQKIVNERTGLRMRRRPEGTGRRVSENDTPSWNICENMTATKLSVSSKIICPRLTQVLPRDDVLGMTLTS